MNKKLFGDECVIGNNITTAFATSMSEQSVSLPKEIHKNVFQKFISRILNGRLPSFS